ncbi:MAG: hypothetical protein MK213_01955 [Planctomycetes bacterium]|nr:hypothetical protein [Planctomycetota bacterium]
MNHPHRLLFVLGLFAIPALFWFGCIQSALLERTDSKGRIANAGRVVEQNLKTVQERNRLLNEWESFKPLALSQMDNLEEDLNPLLLQKRVLLEARQLGFDIKIQEADASGTTSPSWSMTADADFESVVRFVERLEKGDYRVRFSQVDLLLPGNQTENQVKFSAEFSIPSLPNPEEDAA